METPRSPRRCAAATLLVLTASLATGPALAEAINGAIYTSRSDGVTVNANLYEAKADVYLNGGPANAPQCSGGSLDDGDYVFQVTDPSGADLLSSDSVWDRAFRVAGGKISLNLGTHPDSSDDPGDDILPGVCGSVAIQVAPYDDSPNGGGVYKLWITRISDFQAACGVGVDCGLAGFIPGSTKTDNFRVRDDQAPPPQVGSLEAIKFYDGNANGAYDAGELFLEGFQMTLQSANQAIDSTRTTDADGVADWHNLVPDVDYSVTEGWPLEGNWYHSATIFAGHDGSPVNPAAPLPVVAGQTTTVVFGNYCTVPSNGRTLGFWSNKNGQSYISGADLAMLSALNLRNANGSPFDPGTGAALRNWLLKGEATNMAYMLSVQLAAMELNVFNGFVDGGGYYVPAGMTVNGLMAAANTSLGLYPVTTAANDPSDQRQVQEGLKDWLDELNNGAGLLSATPCAFTFE